jgi:RNA polymerase sigma-70 factor (ECF subfamily)
MGTLVQELLAEHPDAGADLEPALEALVAAGRAAWPDLRVDPAAFVRFVARRLPAPTEPAVRALPAADLYLACACAGGDARAMSHFEHSTFGEVDTVVSVMRAPEGSADELKQVLRTRLFVASGGRPAAIAEYGGRGDLRGWIRVSAAREVLRLFKAHRRTVPLEEALLDGLVSGDVETQLVKQRCRADLAAALREALAGLSQRDRTLLRCQVIDGLGVSAIGAIYHVHRATAARWLARIHDELAAETQRRLGERLQLSDEEVVSVIRFVRSQLDLSLLGDLGS